MDLTPYLCLSGLELANNVRTFAYANVYGLKYAQVGQCTCEAIDEGPYTAINQDPVAPWYDSSRSDSEEFLGFYAHDIDMSREPILSRTASPSGTVGGDIGPLRLKSRNIFVDGLMLATSQRGMQYGERWLTEALKGSLCDDDAANDTLLILPACPPEEEMAYADATPWFRTLYRVGCIDGPVFQKQGGLPSWYVQRGAFTLQAGVPWLYHAPTRVLDAADASGGAVYAAMTTTEWMGDGTFVIEVEVPADASGDGHDITITGAVSLDGSCPRGELADDVMSCFEYTIPAMSPGDRIVIDGTRREVRWYGAAAKIPKGGLRKLEFEGAMIWPDVAACTTVCVAIDGSASYGGAGDVLVTVDTYNRES